MARAKDHQLPHAKRKAISSLLPYVLLQEKVGRRDMLGALSHAAMISNSEQFMWRRIQPYITTLSNNPSPPSLDQVIVLGSPHVSWYIEPHNEDIATRWVTRWAAAASAVPYTEEVGQNVVNALLRIASVASLLPHIPVGIWAWLKKQPSLPPVCDGRSEGTTRNVIRHVRALGDIETLKSYLYLVWSEWGCIDPFSLPEMKISIREDFSGIGWGATVKISSNGWITFLGSWIGWIFTGTAPNGHKNSMGISRRCCWR